MCISNVPLIVANVCLLFCVNINPFYLLFFLPWTINWRVCAVDAAYQIFSSILMSLSMMMYPQAWNTGKCSYLSSWINVICEVWTKVPQRMPCRRKCIGLMLLRAFVRGLRSNYLYLNIADFLSSGHEPRIHGEVCIKLFSCDFATFVL